MGSGSPRWAVAAPGTWSERIIMRHRHEPTNASVGHAAPATPIRPCSRPRPMLAVRMATIPRPGTTASGRAPVPCDGQGRALAPLASSGTPHAALTLWIDLFVDLLVTKHGLAAALQSDRPRFQTLHAYFLDRLVPVCAELLSAPRPPPARSARE